MLVVAAVVAAVFTAPSAACAGGWSWPVDGPVRLGYGSTWVDQAGRSCTHGGADIGAPTGSDVVACAEGRVTFAGRVPASGGGSTLAVTVAASDGLSYTCLPLSAVSVTAGAEVSSGVRLGLLAASGDGSSSQTHLHLSVRRGGAAIDPLSLLTSPPPVSAEPVPGGEEPASGALPSASGRAAVAAPRASVAAERVAVPVPAAVPARVAAPVAVGGQVSAPVSAPDPASAAIRTLHVRAYPPAPAGFSRRIRPVATSARLNVGAASAATRAWKLRAEGLAARLLLAALAALLIAPVLRRLSGAVRGASAVAARATAPTNGPRSPR